MPEDEAFNLQFVLLSFLDPAKQILYTDLHNLDVEAADQMQKEYMVGGSQFHANTILWLNEGVASGHSIYFIIITSI